MTLSHAQLERLEALSACPFPAGHLWSASVIDGMRSCAWCPATTPSERYVVLKASGSRYAYVNDTQEGRTIHRYDILKGAGKFNGWELAKAHAAQLNGRIVATGPVEGRWNTFVF